MLPKLLHRTGFFRRHILPKTLYGRFIILIITPVLMVQLFTLWVFYDRHWQHTTKHMSINIINNIKVVINIYDKNTEDAHRLAKDLGLTFIQKPITWKGEKKSANDITGKIFIQRYNQTPIHDLKGVLRFSPPSSVRLVLYDKNRHFIFLFNEYRLYSNTTANLVWYWAITIGIIFGVLALVIARNQAHPIKELSRSLIAFSQGDNTVVEKIDIRGSNEIRAAIYNFKIMAKRLTRQHEQRTNMLSGISHDLRTPLTRIKLLLAMKGDNKNALKNNIRDMEQLIDAYLSFAKGEKEQSPQVTHLHLELQKIVVKWQDAKHNISFTAHDKISSKLRSVSINRMFENIIINAIKYGDIVTIDLYKKKNEALIIITDNGCGIPEEKLQKVFTPFTRVDESRNSDKGGVGLGLSVSLDIATAHGGTIILSNKKDNAGLIVKITLPILTDA